MQKKIIALAVAGLMSGAAFAQSNVTVYGVVDLGYTNLSSSEAPTAANERKSFRGIEQGNQTTSRIGFRGTEDLGNGLTLGFGLEFGVTPDRASPTATANTLSDRAQTLSLSSKTMGTLVMGRLVNPARGLVNSLDPFGGGTAGAGHSQTVQVQTTWADNVIAYVSPNFNGFDVTAAYTGQLAGNETVIQKAFDDTNVKGYVFVPKYSNGPMMVGFSYERFNSESTAVGTQDLKLRRWNLAGSYDFGVAKLGMTYGKHKQNEMADATNNAEVKQWMLSGWIPVTANGTILASYNRATTDQNDPVADRKVSQFALGYNHAMSKRTNAYVTYASLSTNNAAEGNYSVGTLYNASAGTLANFATPGGANGYTKGLNIGLKHTF